MTGYGEATLESGGVRAHVVARAVNHRGLDVRISAPSNLDAREASWREAVRTVCHRGRVELRVQVAATAGAAVDASAVDGLVAAYRAACERHDAGPPRVDELLLSDVALSRLAGGAAEVDAAMSAPVANEAVVAALAELVMFREREGQALRSLFVAHIAELEATIDRIESLAASTIDAHRERLRAAVAALLEQTDVDEGRLEAEVVLIAQRSDIAEEIQRAREHLRALIATMESEGDTPRGRRLDFLLQELVRETNTMGSKSVSAALTEQVVGARTLVEQLREQANNVE